jgi:divalent metal cation (Fe/Co/Zn/Cd) transporter
MVLFFINTYKTKLTMTGMNNDEQELYRKAYRLAIFTIFYNLLEGLVSIYFGFEDEALTLFGFGVDSFIEVISGIGIFLMITRIWQNPQREKGAFEITALKITGTCFYILVVGLVAGGAINIISGHKPETTLWGIIISLVSIAVMVWLAWAKISTGKKINSDAIIADGKCTRVCVYMSLILLASSLIYALTGFGWIDTVGAFGLAWFSYNEGREAFEKARGNSCNCGGHCSN